MNKNHPSQLKFTDNRDLVGDTWRVMRIMAEFIDSDFNSNADMVNLNLKALILMTQTVLPYIKEGGKIIVKKEKGEVVIEETPSRF